MVFGVVWLIYYVISSSIRAEHNLHSTLFVVRLVDEFVYENHRWPRAWSELEELEFSGNANTPRNGELKAVRVGGAMRFQWPADSPALQCRVAINFQANLNEIVEQETMEFEGIKPIGPYYEYRDYGIVDSLQETIRTILDDRESKRLD